ncbi:50S ribosomal protein L22 [Patescibacteria group bacterium]|nr:50S ribosomal protein L22 [Patescibacteria group bacterium]MBU1673649.1 50S ribosomal protein L22 [Patescibacteria group bacterium]MBU1963863.1 50S ribosomal protein L22 [Patescibacteria group bacterium]
MEARAYLKNLQISPRKVRLVADMVRGLDIAEAQKVLAFNEKKSAPAILKLMNSAAANAVNNNNAEKNKLFIKTIMVDEGFTLKRWKPRAMGRATPILKRASRVTIIVANREGTKDRKPQSTKNVKSSKTEKKKAVKADFTKSASKKTKEKK